MTQDMREALGPIMLELRRLIHPLTQQGEDRIWRPAEKACALIDKAEGILSTHASPPLDTKTADIVGRLRRKWPIENKRRFGLHNPDGPEAAALIESQARQIAEAREVIEPFGKMGRMLDGPFGPALFRDEQPLGLGGAWSENGETRTLTFGDLRRAARWMGKGW